MRRAVNWIFVGLSMVMITVVLFLPNDKSKQLITPEPFDLETAEEDPNYKRYKNEYKSMLYHADPSLNVDSIRAVQRIQLNRHSNTRALPPTLNTLNGEWVERGPMNEAGDMQEIDYDERNDNLFGVSIAGHLFQGNLDKRAWKVLNDRINLNTGFLEHVKLENGGDRLLAITGTGKQAKIPVFSDDLGITWQFVEGIDFYDHYGQAKAFFEMSDGAIYYFVHTWDEMTWSSSYELYRSGDGKSYDQIWQINQSDL